MRLSVLIVDDEPLARDVLQVMLQARDDVVIAGLCSGGAEAVECIRKQSPDLVFLDVQMPEVNGFAVIDAIGAAAMPHVIFVTAFDQYAVRAFETHALDYLLKPFDHDRLDLALSRAFQAIHRGQEHELKQKLEELLAARNHTRTLDKIPVRDGNRVTLLPTDKIDWIEAEGDYIRIHVGQRTWLRHGTLVEACKKLNPARFQRVHRSAIINLEHIESIERGISGDWIATLINGANVRISRRYRTAIHDLLESWR